MNKATSPNKALQRTVPPSLSLGRRRHRTRSIGKTILILLFLIAFLSTRAADSPSPFPLLGLWRVVSAVGPDGKSPEGPTEAEFEFLPDGVLVVTAKDPAKGINKPIRLRFRYTFKSPDVVTYTLDGSAHERQRFKLAGDALSFEHLDHATKIKFRRIKQTEFREKPTDTQEFPK